MKRKVKSDKKENSLQQLKAASENIGLIKANIDALVVSDKKEIKVYTAGTADTIYRILIEKMHEGAVTLNEEGIILYCNSYFADLMHLPLQKAIGAVFMDFIDESSREKVEILIKQASVNAVKGEVYLYAKNKKSVSVLLSINSLPLDGRLFLSIIITDLTTLNKNQEELTFRANLLLQKNLELAKVNKELSFLSREREKRAAELEIAIKELMFQNQEKEKRAEELMLANKELNAFNFLSSHDLQEPLRKIQILTALVLERENLSVNGMDYFVRIQVAAGRMRQLIDDLLTYSNINISDYKFVKTNLNTITTEVLAELEDIIREKHAIINVSRLGQINIIPFQFRQLMLNLINNSLKFSHSRRQPEITIKSRIEKGEVLKYKKLSPNEFYCHIMVQDNGIGFEPHLNERIFEIFQRLHGKEVYPGTGIGLAIVKKIVENHKGYITSSSKTNRGARFDIYFPEN